MMLVKSLTDLANFWSVMHPTFFSLDKGIFLELCAVSASPAPLPHINQLYLTAQDKRPAPPSSPRGNKIP